jgi:hypothetical protein
LTPLLDGYGSQYDNDCLQETTRCPASPRRNVFWLQHATLFGQPGPKKHLAAAMRKCYRSILKV